MTTDQRNESPGSKPTPLRNLANRIASRLGILSATSGLVTLVLAWASVSSELRFLDSVTIGTLVCALLSGVGAFLAGFAGAIYDVSSGRGGGRQLGCGSVTILLFTLWVALLIPSTCRSRFSYNEAEAAGTMRTISKVLTD